MAINNSDFSMYVERQLVAEPARVFDAPDVPRDGMAAFPPMQTVPLGYPQYSRQIMQEFGEAQFIDGRGDDLPYADAAVIDDVYNTAYFGIKYGYNVQDLHTAQATGRDIDGRKGIAARRAIERLHNDIIVHGASRYGLYGILSLPRIPRLTLSAALFRSGATVPDTFAALFLLRQTVEKLTNKAERPTHIYLPTDVYNYLDETPIGSDYSVTFLSVYRARPGALIVEKMSELDGAGPNGGDMIFVCSKQDDKIESIAPLVMDIQEAQQKNLAIDFILLANSGGMATSTPAAHLLVELI